MSGYAPVAFLVMQGSIEWSIPLFSDRRLTFVLRGWMRFAKLWTICFANARA
jgi:hypothetical protein